MKFLLNTQNSTFHWPYWSWGGTFNPFRSEEIRCMLHWNSPRKAGNKLLQQGTNPPPGKQQHLISTRSPESPSNRDCRLPGWKRSVMEAHWVGRSSYPSQSMGPHLSFHQRNWKLIMVHATNAADLDTHSLQATNAYRLLTKNKQR